MATILIVDDRTINRQFLMTLLGYNNHRLLPAADGAEAHKLVYSEHPDLIISDILMPTMDGVRLALEVRKDPDTAHTPIIFYTATYRMHEARRMGETCVVSLILPKPSEPETILRTINEALGVSTDPFVSQLSQFVEYQPMNLITNKLSNYLTGRMISING